MEHSLIVTSTYGTYMGFNISRGEPYTFTKMAARFWIFFKYFGEKIKI